MTSRNSGDHDHLDRQHQGGQGDHEDHRRAAEAQLGEGVAGHQVDGDGEDRRGQRDGHRVAEPGDHREGRPDPFHIGQGELPRPQPQGAAEQLGPAGEGDHDHPVEREDHDQTDRHRQHRAGDDPATPPPVHARSRVRLVRHWIAVKVNISASSTSPIAAA